MHGSTILTYVGFKVRVRVRVHTSMWSWCKHILCAHYNPLASFVAITHNTNWQKVGGGGGVNKYHILH